MQHCRSMVISMAQSIFVSVPLGIHEKLSEIYYFLILPVTFELFCHTILQILSLSASFYLRYFKLMTLGKNK